MSTTCHAHRALLVAAMATLLAACGGGGGGRSAGGSGTGSGGGPIVNPPPPSNSINRSFSLNPVVSYVRQLPNVGGEYFASAVAVGDVTGDGRPDVAVMTAGVAGQTSWPDRESVVMVFRQKADGTLDAPLTVRYLDTYSWQVGDMVLSDLDRNGVKEIVVGHQEGLSLVRYNAALQALEATKIVDERQYNPGFASLAVEDFDGDGKPDVLAKRPEYGTVLYKGDGAGGLSAREVDGIPNLSRPNILAREMNGDGKPDLVIYSGDWWVLLLNDGTGRFGNPVQYTLPRRQDGMPWIGWGGDTTDVNRDGRKDLVFSLASNRPAGIGIYLAQADGSYQLDRVLDSWDIPQPIVLVDLDGNGLDDIVTVHGGFYVMGYYLQGPNGFEAETRVSVAINSYPTSHYFGRTLAVADINSDGCRDVVIADSQYGLLALTGANCRK